VRAGNNPAVKLLLLHGGPAATHEYFEAFDSFLPMAGVEYYCYDQLGSFYSNHPDDHSLHELPRFVEEVEQVRQALGLDRDNFCLLGHSWAGVLATEYALAYQEHLKGLVISNVMSSIPRSKDLARITVPTLVIGAEQDSMDPKHMEWMSKQFPRGEYLHCPNGSHMDIRDDQETYMKGLIAFLNK
jgi:proline iminopeptidase